MNIPMKSMEIEKVSCIKVTIQPDDLYEKSIELTFEDWERIPNIEVLKESRIDLSNFNGKLFVQFNPDGTINLIKKEIQNG